MATTSPKVAQAGQPAGQPGVEFSRPVRSLWSDAWHRLRRNKLSMIGLFYLGFLIIVAVAAPLIVTNPPQRPGGTELRERGTYRQAAWIETKDPKKNWLVEVSTWHRFSRRRCV